MINIKPFFKQSIRLILLVLLSNCSEPLSDSSTVIRVGEHYERDKVFVQKKIERYFRIYKNKYDSYPTEGDIDSFLIKKFINPGLLINHGIDLGVLNSEKSQKILKYAKADFITKAGGLLDKKIILPKLSVPSSLESANIQKLNNKLLEGLKFTSENKEDILKLKELVKKFNPSDLLEKREYFYNNIENRISIDKFNFSALSLIIDFPQIDTSQFRINTWIDPFEMDGHWNLIYLENVEKSNIRLKKEKINEIFEFQQQRKLEYDTFYDMVNKGDFCLEKSTFHLILNRIIEKHDPATWFKNDCFSESEQSLTAFYHRGKAVPLKDFLLFKNSQFISSSILTEQDLFNSFEDYVFMEEALKYAENKSYIEDPKFIESWELFKQDQVINILVRNIIEEFEVSSKKIKKELEKSNYPVFPYKKVKYLSFSLRDTIITEKCTKELKSNKSFDSICRKYNNSLPLVSYKNVEINSNNNLDSTLYHSKVGIVIGPIRQNNSNLFLQVESSINDTTKVVQKIKQLRYKKYKSNLLEQLKKKYEVKIKKNLISNFNK